MRPTMQYATYPKPNLSAQSINNKKLYEVKYQ